MNSYIVINSLPKITVAHKFNAIDYKNDLPVLNNYLEFGYVKYGSLTCKTKNISYTLKKGDFFIHDRSHKISVMSSGISEHHCVGIECSFLFNHQKEILKIKSSINNSVLQNDIDELILLSNTDPSNSPRINFLLFKVLYSFNEELNKDLSDIDINNETMYIEKIKKYVSFNLSKKILLNDVAKSLGITKEYMCSLYKKSTGETIVSFINNQKITMLKNLLMDKNLSLKEACSYVGIDDPSYASKLFKKIESQTINNYKLSYRNKLIESH